MLTDIMLPSKNTFIGIDASGGHDPFTYAALDEECKLVALASGETEDVIAFLANLQAAVVAVNAPACPNKGLVRRKVEQLGLTPGHLRGTDMRLAEQELRERGILISPTPSRKETCAAWMQAGFDLYSRLNEAGFKPYPAENATHQVLETHPHAAFCALLGQLPLPKPTLEGRLQRQLVLHANDVGIKDPMAFFEEVTRHWLLKGVLPMDTIYGAEELDALVAALTACLAARGPSEVVGVGDRGEGQIILPVGVLMESYS
jgi:predicted nuclease with RNAse H fold